MEGHYWNGSPTSPYRSFSPSSQYLSFFLASANPTADENYAGSVAPDFLSIRRSQTRSIGSGNSPRQGGMQTSFTNVRPQSANSNRHPLSPITVNNCRPSQPQEQRSSHVPAAQKTQPSVSRGSRFSASLWESHRAKIKELFMDNDKSLDETMKFMEENFSFSPSYVPRPSISVSISSEY
jgi:Clr5 domain